jgi:hypothetical protein
MELPHEVVDIATIAAGMPGVVAVVLGGSRATGESDLASDWDLGVYYRGAIDTSALAARGTVYPPGAWGRVMNGGAWLTCGALKVDVLLRDLDVVDAWSHLAAEGRYEVDALLGYVAGVPTYTLLAERATARTIRGALPPVGPYPAALAATASERWRYHARFTLEHARSRARRGDVVGAVAQASKAVIERAHAVLAAKRAWVFNEKRIVDRAGLAAVHALFAAVPGGAPGEEGALATWVEQIARALGEG